MAWIADDALVGRRVEIRTGYGESCTATIIAVSDRSDIIKVRTDDGDVMKGRTYEY